METEWIQPIIAVSEIQDASRTCFIAVSQICRPMLQAFRKRDWIKISADESLSSWLANNLLPLSTRLCLRSRDFSRGGQESMRLPGRASVFGLGSFGFMS